MNFTRVSPLWEKTLKGTEAPRVTSKAQVT